MIYVGVRDLKAKLSEYLDRAQSGDEVIITEHGRPIARITKEPRIKKSTVERLHPLVENGLLQLPSRSKSKLHKPLKSKSKTTASEILLGDR